MRLGATAASAATASALMLAIPAGGWAQATSEVRLFHRTSNEDARRALLASFGHCEQVTGLTIVENYVPPAQYETQLPIRLASSNPPDIYALWPGARSTFQAENGKIADISALLPVVSDRYHAGIVEGMMEADGLTYTLPVNFQPNLFWFNKRVFDRLGLTPPDTWDGLLKAAEKVKGAGITPFALGSGLGWEPLFWFDYLLLRTAGHEFRARLMQGKESYTSLEVVRVMETWKDLLDRGFFNNNITSIGFEEMAVSVANGRAAMQLMGPWTASYFIDAGLVADKDFGIFPFPPIEAGIVQAVEGALQGFAISGQGPNTEGAMRMLECLSGLEAQTAFVANSQRLAANRYVPLDVYQPAEFQPFIARYLEMLDQPFQQNLELAAHPAVVEVAKREFPRFLTYPDQYMRVLERLEVARKASRTR